MEALWTQQRLERRELNIADSEQLCLARVVFGELPEKAARSRENQWTAVDNKSGTTTIEINSVKQVSIEEFCKVNDLKSVRNLDIKKTYKLPHPTGRIESGWQVTKIANDSVQLSKETKIEVQSKKDHNGLLEVMPGSNKNHVREVENTLKQVAPNVLNFLQKAGYKIVVTPRITQALPHLAGVEPRGWGGLTFDNSDGTMDEIRKLIVSPDQVLYEKKWAENSRPDVVSHQIAHAVDAILGNYSDTNEFRKAYIRDIDNIPKSAQNHIYNYLTQPGGPGRKEAYACLAGMILTGPENADDRQYFEKHFPNLISLLTKHLKDLK